jgi:hypothetical protein
VAVGADRATGPPEAIPAAGIVGRRRDLVVGPGVTTVGRGCHDQRLREARHAPEGRVADVGVSEERARRGVVGPHLLLVGEQRRVLLAHDHRGSPIALVGHDRSRQPGRGRPVDARDRHRLEPVEPLPAREVGGQVRVVQARPVAPREAAVPEHRTERHRWIAAGHHTGLEVAGQRADRADARCARRVAVAWCADAAARAEAGVGGLDPRAAAVERERDARHSDALRERTGVVGAGVARLHVDVVVGSRRQHGRTSSQGSRRCNGPGPRAALSGSGA